MYVISCVKNICYIDELDVSLAWVIVHSWSTVCLNCTFQELFLYRCELYTYESYACPFQNHNWTVLFCIHRFNHLYYKSIPYVLALHLIGICLDSKHCHYTYMNLFINIKILKSELSWCCRNRILPVQHIWRAGSSVLSDPIES